MRSVIANIAMLINIADEGQIQTAINALLDRSFDESEAKVVDAIKSLPDTSRLEGIGDEYRAEIYDVFEAVLAGRDPSLPGILERQAS